MRMKGGTANDGWIATFTKLQAHMSSCCLSSHSTADCVMPALHGNAGVGLTQQNSVQAVHTVQFQEMS